MAKDKEKVEEKECVRLGAKIIFGRDAVLVKEDGMYTATTEDGEIALSLTEKGLDGLRKLNQIFV